MATINQQSIKRQLIHRETLVLLILPIKVSFRRSLKGQTAVTAIINGTTYIYVLGGDGNSGNVDTVYKAPIEFIGKHWNF